MRNPFAKASGANGHKHQEPQLAPIQFEFEEGQDGKGQEKEEEPSQVLRPPPNQPGNWLS
jgi:hypothetical protein